jgi:hypothetical protein
MAGLPEIEPTESQESANQKNPFAGARRAILPVLWALIILAAALCALPVPCSAQISYVARFTLEKQKFILGEPIFCKFVIQNTGVQSFSFRFRPPDRAENGDLEGEPRFRVTAKDGRTLLPDPAPHPCGGAMGSVVYGSVTLPPGKTHTERWLLNQWARVSRPGRYHVRAERRLALFTVSPGAGNFSGNPAAYAGALDEFWFEVNRAPEAELRAAFQPYIKLVGHPAPVDPAEAVLVLSALPQPFFLDQLDWLALASPGERRWDRNEALEGLARLGTPAAWQAIAQIAAGEKAVAAPLANQSMAPPDDTLRAYAILLMGEKGDARFLPTLIKIVNSEHPADSAGSTRENLGGDALRALGFFHHPRANEVLFEKLHAAGATDRVNAILGLKNLGGKDSIPALIAMLRDPDSEVREVANFALQGLTGQHIKLSPSATRAESDDAAKEWDRWWQEHATNFVPRPQSACHDW